MDRILGLDSRMPRECNLQIFKVCQSFKATRPKEWHAHVAGIGDGDMLKMSEGEVLE
jgi:hypothetical protein